MRYLLLLPVLLLLASCSDNGQKSTQLFPLKSGNLYQFIDRNGKVVIPAQYREVSRYTEGMALACPDDGKGRWGYLDQDGNFTIAAQYREGTIFSEGIALVTPPGEAPEGIDKTGKLLFSLQDVEQVNTFHEGLAAVNLTGAEGERWGFINTTGKLMIEPVFVRTGYFSDGFCAVSDETGKWGYISSKGIISIPFHFDNVDAFRNGEARAMLNGKWGIIDKSGKFILNAAYDDVYPDGVRYLVNKGGQWRWLGKDQKPLYQPVFTSALPFYSSTLAPVRTAAKWGYMDASGKFPIAPQFDFAFCFDGDVALVASNGKYGLIDKTGAFVAEPAYDRVAVDYLIGTFSAASAYYSVRTDINAPRHIAYTWLSGFYHLRFDEAVAVSAEETRKLLVDVAGMLNGLDETSRMQMMRADIGIKGYEQQGDSATVRYTITGNSAQEKALHLVKLAGRWYVQVSPQDVSLTRVAVADSTAQ